MIFFFETSDLKTGRLGSATLLADELNFRQRVKIQTRVSSQDKHFLQTVTV